MTNSSLLFILLLSIFSLFSCHRKNDLDYNRLTGINPLAYTSVIYTASKDTAIISTYSGRIAKRINKDSLEYLIAAIHDEIYALAYIKSQGKIIASTLRSGILVINSLTGKIEKKLILKDTWTIRLSLTKDEKYLFTTDLKGKNHVWDVENDYNEIQLPEIVSEKTIRLADDSGKFYFSSKGMGFVWDINSRKMESELTTNGNRFVDVDQYGNLLLINHNECSFYNSSLDSVQFKVSHPSWIYLGPEGEILAEIPLSMQLTKARFANDKIYTSGIDRSIHVWNKTDGTLLDHLTGHKATVSDMDVSKNYQQLVSVDLKGNIKFWDIE